MNEDKYGNQDYADILCSGGTESQGLTCQDDTRVRYDTTDTQCAITISNTEPEDSGIWTLMGATLGSTGVSR